jgi:hypothetical protein
MVLPQPLLVPQRLHRPEGLLIVLPNQVGLEIRIMVHLVFPFCIPYFLGTPQEAAVPWLLPETLRAYRELSIFG